MSTRITECRGIDAAEAKDCVETGETPAAVVSCTVATDACTLTTGDAEAKEKELKKEAVDAVDEDAGGCCCCDC